MLYIHIPCRRCGLVITPHHHSVKYCSTCREYKRLHRYEPLTDEQKRSTVKARRKWAKEHPEYLRKTRRETKDRHNEESLEFTINDKLR